MLLFKVAGLHYLPAAVGSFLVAVANNYTLNRLWTFKEHQGSVAYQGPRFLVVSTLALGANLVVLYVLVKARCRRDPRAGDRDHPRDAAQLRRQQALVFPPVRRWACAVALALLLAPAAGAADTTGTAAPPARHAAEHAGTTGRSGSAVAAAPSRSRSPPHPRRGRLTKSVVIAELPRPSQGRALARALSTEAADRRDVRQGDAAVDGDGVVGARGRDRPREGRGRATGACRRRSPARRSRGAWRAGGSARSAARSSTPGGCGRRSASSSSSGSSTGAGSVSWHTVDLLALLSFGFSLLFFNRGHIFMSASLGALPLAYLVVRTSWIGFRGRACEPGALVARLAARGRSPSSSAGCGSGSTSRRRAG